MQFDFSGTSGCLLFLDWLVSFVWLCEEEKCFYLHLHLGQNSQNILKTFLGYGFQCPPRVCLYLNLKVSNFKSLDHLKLQPELKTMTV